MEVGAAVRPRTDHLAINDRRLALEFLSRGDDRRISPRPIIAVPRPGPRQSVIDDEERAVAVMLDFVNPAFAPRRFDNQRRQHRGNEGGLTQDATHVPEDKRDPAFLRIARLNDSGPG